MTCLSGCSSGGMSRHALTSNQSRLKAFPLYCLVFLNENSFSHTPRIAGLSHDSNRERIKVPFFDIK